MLRQPEVRDRSATATLLELILARPYLPGSRLPPERELVALLGVSRPTVREAIARMAQEGTVVSRRGSGTYVAPIDFQHVFEVRLRLEPFAAALAAEKRTEHDLEQLSRLIGKLESTIDSPSRFAESDHRLHAAVVEATHNPVLVDVVERLSGLTALSRELTGVGRSTRDETVRHLRRVVAGIRQRDGIKASSAMQLHLEHVARQAPPIHG